MDDPPWRKALDRIDARDAIDLLTERLSGAELTSVLLEIMRRRAASVTPSELVRRHAADRFVGAAAVPYLLIREAEAIALSHLPAETEVIALAPLVPLGTHSALGPVSQNNVVSTIRGSEVAADPTNGLALEAAVRRRWLLDGNARSAALVRLAAIQRVVRAQRFEGDATFAHFELFALVTAGRDTGNLEFERRAAAEHASFAVDVLRSAGADHVRVSVSDFTGGRLAPVCEAVRDAVGGRAEVVLDPDRPDGRAYYDGFRFTTSATIADTTLEIGDGGLVDWTQQLVASRKERLFTSALGIDRLAIAMRS